MRGTREYVIATALLAAGCQATTLPRPECAAARRAPADYGMPTPLATTTSVAIELRAGYIAERVRSAFEAPLQESATADELAVPAGMPGSIPQGGVLVKAVELTEEEAGGDRLHLLTVRITPWIRRDQPDSQSAGRWRLSRSEIPRYFALRLRLLPRLVLPATEPDAARRRTLLRCGADPGCGESGVIIPFELSELRDVSNGEVVACTSANYDVVTQRVHQGVLDALYGTAQQDPAPPLVLPGQKIVDLVGGIAGSPVRLTGVALGSDGDLKIGFLTDQGAPLPFVAATGLSRFPGADWGVLIDPSFITAAITRKVRAAADSNNPPVTVQAVDVSYDRTYTGSGWENRITVNAPATTTALNCTVPLAIRADIVPSIRRNAADSSVIAAPTSQSVTRGQSCLLVEALWLFRGALGRAEVTVCSPGPCPATPPPPRCPELTTVQFAVGPGEEWYATDLDTGGGFYIAGRSTFVDRLLAARGAPARSAVPSCL